MIRAVIYFAAKNRKIRGLLAAINEPNSRKIRGRNYSYAKELNPSFRCEIETPFSLSVTNLSKILTGDSLNKNCH